MKKVLLSLLTTMLSIVNGYSTYSSGETVITGKVSGLSDVSSIPVYYTVSGDTHKTGVLTDNSGNYRITLPSNSGTVEVYAPPVFRAYRLYRSVPEKHVITGSSATQNKDFAYTEIPSKGSWTVANVSHTYDNNVITLQWTAVTANVKVRISIFSPATETFIDIADINSSDERYDFHTAQSGEYLFWFIPLDRGIEISYTANVFSNVSPQQYTLSGSITGLPSSEPGNREIRYIATHTAGSVYTNASGSYQISGLPEGATVEVYAPELTGYNVTPGIYSGMINGNISIPAFNYNAYTDDDPDDNPTAYTVTFNGDNINVPPQTVNRGDRVAKPADPVWEGYVFDGWYNSSNYWELWDFDSPVNGGLTLTGQWRLKRYAVIFQEGDISPQTVNHGSKASKPADPTRTGYSFGGWYNGSNLWDFNSSVTDDLYLTAKWTAIAYTITFAGDNISISPQAVNHGDKVIKPADPTRTGYSFGGWYNGSVLWDFNSSVTGNLTLTAKWTAIAYTVTFAGDNINISPQLVNHEDKATKPADPTRTGYSFGGWYNGSNLWDFNSSVTGNLTLTAKWTSIAYTVTFAGDNISISPQAVNHGDKATKPADPTRTGYSFGGWYNGSSLWDFNSPVTGNLTLAAKWITGGYTVSFTGTGIDIATQLIDEGGRATKPVDPTRTGYIFRGWYNGNSEWDFNTPVTTNLTLTAVWNVKSCSVIFTGEGVTLTLTYALYGNKISKIDDPVREGYVFDGWYNGNSIWNFDTPVTEDVTLTARWTTNTNQYTVSFAGENVDIATQLISEGNRATRPADPTRAGYIFGGWYNGNSLWDFNTSVTGNMTLTARWTTSTNQYTVSFAGEGVDIATQLIAEGNRATRPADPTRADYVFGGWYNENSLWDFNTPVTENMTLEARWTTNQYAVSFAGESVDIATQLIAEGSRVTRPADPTRAGYIFGGWYNGNNLWDFNTSVTENMILSAKWETPVPVPIFDGLEREYTVSSPATVLKVKGTGSEKLTVFRVNGQVTPTFNPSAKGTFLIEALSADGKLRIETYIIVK
ncbi:MAG: InlB B-repeat-containing protein [Prevotellaceae bacterium]|jgi:uncharacterized repeat protein (TIGR02543 family)|nr:InlB B-repeat-containing protein [Prevotellaceae bacterium]